MKIAKIEQFFPRRRMRLVKITTDNGIVGWGETTLEGKPKSTHAAVEELTDYFVGKDPLRIEHHWQHVYRSAFFRGGNVLMSALSGIDQALWDIAGKHLGVPAFQLMGGPVRDRIRVYAHWGIRDLSDEGLAASKDRLEKLQKQGGYKAFKSGPGGKWRAHEPPAVIDEFVKKAYLMREWVGEDCEIAFDFHGKMTPGLATEVCQELKGMRPMFVEEPVPQENVDALKVVSDKVTFPIATGERLLSRWEFREIFEKQAVSLIQPDGSHAGGISELKRIANMAEVYFMHIMPHCAIGPVAFSACMQVDAVVPNFLIQEQVDVGLGEGLLKEPWVVKDGHIDLPTKPGLGFEIDEKEAEQDCGICEEELGGEFYYENDGSVADW
ncbi:TPA: galactonate dehydratase [Candidatus Latescibacteria bacterium]|jgi:galactonate dehydratase|nr:galactonate dehydratase [Gemmatimonadota bacterium]MBS10635.1 galactonate dehydratase [Gemmatimonadota bacterium]HAA77736.1 galactonate dehydratase [Candidatus Latescibacterota bacterium]